MASRSDREEFQLWECNKKPLSVFMKVSTQWRTAGMSGVFIGLDYNAVAIVCRAMKIKLDQELLDDIQVMELAAMEFYNKGR